ncbi:hypothetical protein FRB96_000337 [Tulasnella sp. 330]|nr:hypothetical protein FRB96_000337 [Tulasnella sp. 330]
MRYAMYDSLLSSDLGSFVHPSPLADSHSATAAPVSNAKTEGRPDSMDVEMEDITSRLRNFPTPMPPGAYPRPMENLSVKSTTRKSPGGRTKKPRNPTLSSATYMFGRTAPYNWSPVKGVKYDVSPTRGAKAAPGHGKEKPTTPTKEVHSRHPSPKVEAKAPPSAFSPKPTPHPDPNSFSRHAHYRAAPRTKFGPFDNANIHTPSPTRLFGDRYTKHTSPFGKPPGLFEDRMPQAQARKQTRHTMFDRKMNMAGLRSDPRQTSLPKINPNKPKTSTKPRKPLNLLPNFPPRPPFNPTGFHHFIPTVQGAMPRSSPFGNHAPAGSFEWAPALSKPFVPPVPVFDPPVVRAWAKYERRWDTIKVGGLVIRLSMIPWPMENYAASAFAPFTGEITSSAIGAFIFNPLHSTGISKKKRIQNALRVYHPDKFAQVLERMNRESEKELAKSTGDVVVRVLNEMLANEV